MKRRWMAPNFSTEVDVGKGTVGSKLDVMVDKGLKRGDKVGRVVVKLGLTGDGAWYVPEDEFFLQAPDLLTVFVDGSVLMGMDVIGEGAGRSSPEVREELMLSVERDNGEGELLENRGGQGRQGNNSNRGFNDGRQKVLDWDIRKWDAVDDFLKLEVDIGILGFVNGGVLVTFCLLPPPFNFPNYTPGFSLHFPTMFHPLLNRTPYATIAFATTFKTLITIAFILFFSHDSTP